MRLFAMFVLSLGLVLSLGTAASAAPQAPAHPASANPQLDARDRTSAASLEYLLVSAAADFHEHGPRSARFRKVRFGSFGNGAEGRLFLICGELQPAIGADAGKWVEFATVRTSGYEQWLGEHGGGYCHRERTHWEPGDLSAELQRRVTALR